MSWKFHPNNCRNTYRQHYWTRRKRGCNVIAFGNEKEGFEFYIYREADDYAYSSQNETHIHNELPIIGRMITGPQEMVFIFFDYWLDKNVKTVKQREKYLKEYNPSRLEAFYENVHRHL